MPAGIKDKHACMEDKRWSALWSSCRQMPKKLCRNSSSRGTHQVGAVLSTYLLLELGQLEEDLASHGSNHLW